VEARAVEVDIELERNVTKVGLAEGDTIAEDPNDNIEYSQRMSN